MNNKIPTLLRNAELEKACGFEALHYAEALAYGQACWEAALEQYQPKPKVKNET